MKTNPEASNIVDSTRFAALSNLLSMRNGGQLELPVELDDFAKWDEELDDDDIEDADTNLPTQITGSENRDLKKRFLDRLGELLSRQKGGYDVVCCVMQEGESDVQIYVTKNAPFIQPDYKFMKSLEILLAAISNATEIRDELEAELWRKMLTHHKFRLSCLKIRLTESLEKYNGWAAKNRDAPPMPTNSIIYQYIQEMRALLAKENTSECRENLVLKAYVIRRNEEALEFLQNSSERPASGRQLWLNICFLGRIREAFMTLANIAKILPCFAKVTISPVPAPEKSFQKKSISHPIPLTLEQTYRMLGLSLNDTTIKTVIGKNQSIGKAIKTFDELQKHLSDMHAEMQMILYLSRKRQTNKVVFDYLGCSKRSCFLCYSFLQAYGGIISRGCHGKLYSRWTIPCPSDLPGDAAKRIHKAIKETQNVLARNLLSPIVSQRQHVAESSVACHEIEDELGANRNPLVVKYKLSYQATLEKDKMKTLFRQLISEPINMEPSCHTPSLLSSNTFYEEVENDYCDVADINKIANVVGECSHCGSETNRKCSQCGKSWYCSDSCQKEMDINHFFTCSPGRPLNTADYLWLDIVQDRLPEDPQTRTDYGFDRTLSFVEETNLLGLFQGLLWMDVTREQVHQWRLEGLLVDKINEHYKLIPESQRGKYHSWFTENQHLLDGSMGPIESIQSRIDRWITEAQPYLEPDDRIKKAHELHPDAKRDSFYFLAMVLQSASPPPNHPLYSKFGFCTCIDEWQESSLGGLYIHLLIGKNHKSLGFQTWIRTQDPSKYEPCTFSEFWQAYEKGRIPQLFRSRGLYAEFIQFKHLEEFLSVPPDSPQLSVWTLNEFLACKEDLDAPNPVLADYGFINCDTVRDKMELKEFYENLLPKGDALDLHQACIKGEIYDYAVRVLNKVEPQIRKLVRNVYPLAEE